ncbi:hypothetical protein NDK43_06700 [Neobacillus pocheonensis]|uniref:DUF4176 domain-containing protein n=1 Tax=Neobacillus pocheonensis TaxID=363869 RepID=A0ABT0W9G2_9BACI|nr:hypothetical protein [Neobacillus pocheonensis]
MNYPMEVLINGEWIYRGMFPLPRNESFFVERNEFYVITNEGVNIYKYLLPIEDKSVEKELPVKLFYTATKFIEGFDYGDVSTYYKKTIGGKK